MKFWHKIFIGVLIIFLVAFDAQVIYLTSYSYNFSRQRETDNSIREQEVILSSVMTRISNMEAAYPDVSHDAALLPSVIRPLAEYYSPQGVLPALYLTDDEPGYVEVFSDIPDIDAGLLDIDGIYSKNVMELLIDGRRHILIASQIPGYPHLIFVYARDISQIDDFRADVSRVFSILNALLLVFLGISIYLLLKRLTKPITELTVTTADIAGGAYSKRVPLYSGDELGQLAGSFNRMADSVEEQMTRLKRATDDRQQFIDDLTHEMRTPLTSIVGYAEYLQNAKCSEEERNVAINHLFYMANRLNDLSNKLMELTFLRGEKIEMRPVDVNKLLHDLQVSALPLLIPRSISLDVESSVGQIPGDETLLLSLLINLVENAGRASTEGSAVRVKAYYAETCPVIEVADSGRGMTQEDIERIKEPFYRVDKSRSREFGGVGLGMSIASQIIAMHGARMDIDSVPDAGTTVKISFKDK